MTLINNFMLILTETWSLLVSVPNQLQHGSLLVFSVHYTGSGIHTGLGMRPVTMHVYMYWYVVLGNVKSSEESEQ